MSSYSLASIPRVKGDTPTVSSVYQLPNSILFDESTRPSDEVRKDYINRIKNEIERLIAANFIS